MLQTVGKHVQTARDATMCLQHFVFKEAYLSMPQPYNTTISMTRHIIIMLILMLPLTTRADDWMAHLNDNTPVCRLLIPGTHDAATGDGFTTDDAPMAAVIAQTQEKSIAAQWHSGVRAFDLRPAVRTNTDGSETLHIYHGEFATTRSFGSVLRQIADSLTAHPTEFAIILMRHESSSSRNETHWAQLMHEQLDSMSDHLATFHPNITVGELRGRILIISRNTYAPLPKGAYAGGWSHSKHIRHQTKAWLKGCTPQDSAQLMVQDFYDTSHIGGHRDKRRAIKAMFAMKKRTDAAPHAAPVWMINHASGYSLTVSVAADEPVSLSRGYRDNASHTNAFVIQQLRSGNATSGIVLIDFAGIDHSEGYNVMGETLVKEIIKTSLKEN